MKNLHRILKIFSGALIVSTLCFIVGGVGAMKISEAAEGSNGARDEIKNFDVKNSKPYKFFKYWCFEAKEIIPAVINAGFIPSRNEKGDWKLLMKRLDQEWDTLYPRLSLSTSNFIKNVFKDEKTREEMFEKYEEIWWEESNDEAGCEYSAYSCGFKI